MICFEFVLAKALPLYLFLTIFQFMNECVRHVAEFHRSVSDILLASVLLLEVQAGQTEQA